jgi:hypothetical protein
MHDQRCREICGTNPNMMVPWYLMASFLYYWHESPILSDACYDDLCRRLAMRWPRIVHRHKSLIERGALAAGTCMLAQADYPLMTQGAAFFLLSELRAPPAKPAPEPEPLQRPLSRRAPAKAYAGGFFLK